MDMSNTLTLHQEPVTGREYLGDQTQPLQALALFYKAFNSGDLALMEQNWENSEEAAMDNPLGGIKRGWADIRTVYERIFKGPAEVQVEFYDYSMHEIGDVFYVVGRERGTLQAKNLTLDLAIRTSRIFRRGGDGRWQQVHHHGSMDDAELLRKYQEAVK